MKRIGFILALVLLISLTIPASAALPTQDKSCTEGFVGGDVDGDGKVTATDAAELIKYITGWTIPGDASHADTLRDGVINAKDAAKLMQYLAGWKVGRLCHDDEYVTVKDSTIMEQGTARYTCRVCGDFTEETIPYKTYTVCGTDITEYSVICAAANMTGDLAAIMNVSAEELLGGSFESTPVTSKNAAKKTFGHEILVGDVSMFKRDGLPDFSDGQPCYGVTEDGTVFFHVKNAGMLDSMWVEFLREHLGADFRVVNNDDPQLFLVSYDENGADVQPFVRTYESVDLEAEGYKLVLEDDFDGDDLNWDIWKMRGEGTARGGFSSETQVSVSGGNLRLTAEYLADGRYGPGWYSAYVSLQKRYIRGYFEARIKCADNDGGFWSAFWLQGRAPYKPDQSQGGVGPGGCEIDILELFGNDGLTYNLYCAGNRGSTKDADEGFHSGKYRFGDMTGEYHTYALEWDEDCYTVIIDGIVVGQTAFGDGTSVSEEEVIISLEVSDTLTSDTDYTTEMAVDYIRIYQK